MSVYKLQPIPLLGVGLGALLSACVWRTGTADHYFGPVWFRYTAPPAGKAYVGQVLRVGLGLEGGTNWGFSLGVSNRTAIAPVLADTAGQGREARPESGSMPWGPGGTLKAGVWNFSPFYLRVQREPRVFFIARTLHGGEAVVGQDGNALTLGYARRTLFTPPDHAFARLRYDDGQPLEAEAAAWPGSEIPPSTLPRELTHENPD